MQWSEALFKHGERLTTIKQKRFWRTCSISPEGNNFLFASGAAGSVLNMFPADDFLPRFILPQIEIVSFDFLWLPQIFRATIITCLSLQSSSPYRALIFEWNIFLLLCWKSAYPYFSIWYFNKTLLYSVTQSNSYLHLIITFILSILRECCIYSLLRSQGKYYATKWIYKSCINKINFETTEFFANTCTDLQSTSLSSNIFLGTFKKLIFL